MLDVLRKQNVAVADDRNGHGCDHRSDRVPVGGEAIARIARAAVNEQRVGAAVDGGLSPARSRCASRRSIPAAASPSPESRDRFLHRLGDAADALRLAAERRADALVREVIDRAAAIEIDEVGAARFDQRRGPADLSGLVPASCTPKNGSPSNLRISANSPLRRCFSRRATVISLIVTRAPSSTQKRR